MHQNDQKAQFAPWNNRQYSISPFDLQNQYYSSAHIQPTIPTIQAKQEVVNNKNTVMKKMDKYAKVMPKVYQKNQQQMHHAIKRTELKRLDFMLKAIKKNQLIIRVPQNHLQLPKVQVEHPIKHFIKSQKRIDQVADSFADKLDSKNQLMLKKEKQIRGRWSEMREREIKDNEDLSDNKSYVNILKKLNNYEQKMIKKCSLKNLKMYNQHDNSDQKVRRLLQSKQDTTHNKTYEKKERKHILDRILNRLQ